jgi:hypothetical protein
LDRDCFIDYCIIILEHGQILGVQKYCVSRRKKEREGGKEGTRRKEGQEGEKT